MQIDEVGNWSEIKLEIIQKYAVAYSTILSKKKNLHHVYIDAFQMSIFSKGTATSSC